MDEEIKKEPTIVNPNPVVAPIKPEKKKIGDILFETSPDGKRKFLWKNLFKMDKRTMFEFIFLLGLILMYKYDTKVCMDIVAHPEKVCPQEFIVGPGGISLNISTTNLSIAKTGDINGAE